MPGDVAAAIDVDDGCARITDWPVEGSRPFASRVDGLVLQQQAGIGDQASHPLLVDLSLQLPGIGIANRGGSQAEASEHQLIVHAASLARPATVPRARACQPVENRDIA